MAVRNLATLAYCGTLVAGQLVRPLHRATMSPLHRVFVYGTLRQGHPNHHKLLEPANGQARHLGPATTLERYPLVIASRYNIPFLLAAPGHGQNVRGEVYEVDDKMLEVLDALEDHPKCYERKERKMKVEESGVELECWIYLLHRYKPFMMELPFLHDYNAAPEDKKYTASEDDLSDPDDI